MRHFYTRSTYPLTLYRCQQDRWAYSALVELGWPAAITETPDTTWPSGRRCLLPTTTRLPDSRAGYYVEYGLATNHVTKCWQNDTG